MGIPGYSAFFKEEYPSAVTSFKWRQQHATAGASAAQRPSVSLVSPTSAAEEVVIQNRHYDHLLFDINQFLYSAAAKSENEEQVFVRTFSQLNRIFQIFRPHASVFLAQDGPAPVAKFMTQRERRVKKVEKAKAKEELLSMSSLEEEAEEEDESKGTEEDEAEEEGEAVNETIATNGKRFDPINFTPGTPFMQRLKQALCYFACQRLNQLPLQNVAFYVSGSDREGEGELKIFEYLAYNESVLSTDRCLVVGNDADLILYAMMAYTNVDILQCDYGTYHLFNMSTFKKLLHQQVPNAPLEELLMDLTFISLLAGNDYLPKLRGLSLPETWKSYLHLRTTKEYENKRLFNLEESHLDVPFFAQIWAMQKFQIALKDSRKSEQNVRSIFHYMRSKYLVGSAASNLFQKEKSEQGSKLLTYSLKLNGVKLGTATAKSGKEAQTILCRQALGILNEDSESSKVTIDASSSPLFKMMKEQHKGITEDFYYSAIANYWDDITVIGVDSVASTIENQVTKTYQRKKKNTELITALTPEQIASRVKQYMQGIVWAMHYLQGKCIDYSYHYPLAISPQPTEVIEHVPHVDFRCAHSDTTPPLPLPFLMALLPSNSPHLKSHLPEAYQHLLETSSELADLYHGETEEQWASTSPLSLFERLKASIHKVTKTLKQQKAEQTQKHSHLLEFQPTLLFRKIHQQKQPQTFHKHNNNDRQRFDDISDMYRKDPRRLHSAVPEGLVEPPVGRFRPLNHTHLLSCYQEKRGEKGIFSPSNIFVPIQQVRRFSSLRPFATTIRLPHILSHPPLAMMKRNRWTGLAAFTTGMAARALKV